ncbi:MAG: biotin--[acetyl-CoA-carboxylase] ligase [Nitrospiraceae bacterium]
MTGSELRQFERRLKAGLTTSWLGRPFSALASVDSTNSEVLRYAGQSDQTQHPVHGTTIFADEQTAGRGRRGRSWMAVPGGSLCFSFVLQPGAATLEATETHASDRSHLAWIPLATALGLAEGIRAATGIAPQVKWPNDLLSNGRKLGGILCEAQGHGASQQIVVGIGINLDSTGADIPPDLQPIMTCLRQQTRRTIARAELLAALLNALEPCLDPFCRTDTADPTTTTSRADIRRRYRATCITIGKTVRVELSDKSPLTGVAESIADSGALLIRPTADPGQPSPAPVAVFAGDVVHLR